MKSNLLHTWKSKLFVAAELETARPEEEKLLHCLVVRQQIADSFCLARWQEGEQAVAREWVVFQLALGHHPSPSALTLRSMIKCSVL